MRIQKEQAVFVAIDYQEKLVPAINCIDEIMKKSIFLLCGLKELEVPMFMTTQYKKGLGANVSEIAKLVGEENEFDKVTFSIFQNDEVAAHLENSGAKYVIIAGTEAHICVLQSVIDLAASGYIPVLVTDCIGSRNEADKEMALIRARQEGAILTTAEALLYELTVSAKNPKFKAISELVKRQ